MTPTELAADIRTRINPDYATQIGTESYERRLCAEAIEALVAQNEKLQFQLDVSQTCESKMEDLEKERDAAIAALATAIEVGHKALAERDIWEQSCDEQITLLNQIANERDALHTLRHEREDVISDLRNEIERLKADAARYQYIRAGNVYIETPCTYEGGLTTDFYAVIGEGNGRYYKDMDHFDADLDDAIEDMGEQE